MPALAPTVTIFLAGFCLTGTAGGVGISNRLVDVLASMDPVFIIQHARVETYQGQPLASTPEMSIDKSAIYVAIPEETSEYRRSQRLYRAGLKKPDRLVLASVMLLPPFAVKGSIHVPPGTENMPLEHTSLGRFFAVTEASLFLGEHLIREADVMMLSRLMVASISMESGAIGSTTLEGAWAASLPG